MLYQIGIKDGFAQVKGAGRHIKIISATTPVRVQAMDSDGRVLLDSKFRAPMATELPAPAATVNFYADDQTVELWYSLQPLEYLQLTAIGAVKMTAKIALAYPGITKLSEAKPRVSLRIFSESDLLIGENSGGWPVPARNIQEFEFSGDLNVFKTKKPFNIAGVSGKTILSAAVQRKAHYSLTRFKGNFYATAQTGELYRIGNDGSAVDILSSTGGTKAICVKAWQGALYFVTHLSGKVALLRSNDGKNFAKLSEVVHGSPSPFTPAQNTFVKGILSGTLYHNHYFVADLNKGTLALRNMDVSGTSVHYASNGEYDFLFNTGDIKFRKSDEENLPFQTLTNEPLTSGTLSGVDGLLVGINNFKLCKVDLSGVKTVLSTQNFNGGKVFYAAGVDAVAELDKNLFFFDDGMQYSAPNTLMPKDFFDVWVDDETSAIYVLQGQVSLDNTLLQVNLTDLEKVEPAKVNIIEFLP